MAGNVDKLLSSIDKACDVLGNAAELLENAAAEANNIGGKISQIVPKHLEAQIDKIISIAEGADASSLLKLKELIENMPLRDTLATTPADSIAARKAQINLTPNTSAGAQSAAAARAHSLQEAYSIYESDDSPRKGNGFHWESLKESELYADAGHDDFGLGNFTDAPIDTFGHRQKMKEMIENDDYEEMSEHLIESMDGKGHFDWKSMNSPIGSIGNTDFTSLRSTGKDGTDLSQIHIQ
jgi:hypothetical protein